MSGKQLYDLWHEGEVRETIEAKIAKAADSICPIFLRVQFEQSYIPFNITLEDLDKTKAHQFSFSKSFSDLFFKLRNDLLARNLILECRKK